MDKSEKSRLEFLRSGNCVPGDYVHDYYGLTWPLLQKTEELLTKYRSTRRRSDPRCANGDISRYELEGFMVHANVLTRKWMGARLGMDLSSLNRVMDNLGEFGMHRTRYEIETEFIADSLSEDLVRYVPGMRFRTFRDHNAYCARLHDEFRTIGVHIEPLYCETSKELGDNPTHFAMHFDCITLQPLSTRHSAWLDFSKPLSLPPDRCSKLFYARNRLALQDLTAGTTEPTDLEVYEQHIQEVPHA